MKRRNLIKVILEKVIKNWYEFSFIVNSDMRLIHIELKKSSEIIDWSD